MLNNKQSINDLAKKSIEFGLPLFNLLAYDSNALPIGIVNEKLIRTHHALPLFKRDNRLFVAISDTTNFAALDDFKFHTGLNTEAVLVEEHKLAELISKVLQVQENVSITEIANEEATSIDTMVEEDTEDAPIIRFIHNLLLDAVNQNASDIHFEPYETSYRIRFRQDGILRIKVNSPPNLSNRFAACLKVMAHLDIAERRMPQDGRFKIQLPNNKDIAFRVSTCPTLYGEKIVLRILDSSFSKLNIDDLGFEDLQKKYFLNAIQQPQGMVLVTGPTGSGKTISLYTALSLLNTSSTNILSVEDPVEINLAGINQVNVNPKSGLTFSSALRAFLRQDPDVIMVGEIRDLETAEIAIKAAQTGHLVLSTLHTNSAAETLTRFVNMGVAPFNIASSISLIMAQRLVRRLCKHCKTPVELPKKTLVQQGFSERVIQKGISLFKAVGCENCTQGYKGRIGIYEVMPISKTMESIIIGNSSSLDIAEQSKYEGMLSLREAGLCKVEKGVTSLAEINRVI